MMVKDLSKECENTSTNDEFGPFTGKIVAVITESNHRFPLCGRLKSVSREFLNIEKANGRLIMIARRRVLEIWQTHDQDGDEPAEEAEA